MNIDPEHISIEFHARANDLFFSYLRDFKTAVQPVDRARHEYLFQQQREKYVQALHQQLELVARELLRKYQDHRQLNTISQQLSKYINEYQEQFIQHIRAL